MHFIKNFKYIADYKIALTFEDKTTKLVDLKNHLEGEIFEPLKDLSFFKRVTLNTDLDTIVWENGADISPDFLYEIGQPIY